MKKVKKVKKVRTEKVQPHHPLRIGCVVLIRTVTHYHIGRVIELFQLHGVGFVTLEDAAWVADTGRFSEALKGRIVNESEPFDQPVTVGLGSIIDATYWGGTIPLPLK